MYHTNKTTEHTTKINTVCKENKAERDVAPAPCVSRVGGVDGVGVMFSNLTLLIADVGSPGPIPFTAVMVTVIVNSSPVSGTFNSSRVSLNIVPVAFLIIFSPSYFISTM